MEDVNNTKKLKDMKLFNTYKIEISIILILLVLVSVKLFSGKWYKENAQTAINMSLDNKNILTQIPDDTSYLLIDISQHGENSQQAENGFIPMPFNKSVEEETIRQFKRNGSKIVVYSTNYPESCMAWVLLNQLGVNECYVLNTQAQKQEVFNYQFQPDTTARLE